MTTKTRLWTPSRAFVTRSAAALPYGQEILGRLQDVGVPDLQVLAGDRLPNLRGASDRAAFMAAKDTLAVVVAPASQLRLAPIPPSADWRFDLAQGCPAHCQYCYLAGSLTGPPITRVYANLDEILGNLAGHVGVGEHLRADEGTTFEASCYTDPLALEHLTGGLARAVTHVGTTDWPSPVQLRATTKFADVDGLLDLPHAGRTRLRFSVNAASVARRFEGATAPVPERLEALRRVAEAGYPVGLVVAPIMPVDGWRDGYDELFRDVAAVLPVGSDLTVELITHRFTPTSRQTLLDWYPRTKLEMDADLRAQKRSKFGAVKHVYPRPVMAELRSWFQQAVAERLPTARLLYWT